jgi:hypothetical protein
MVLESLTDAILMKHLSPGSRSLYLLALFQLVGGPAVLLVVLLFGKVATRHVSEIGLSPGITKALHCEEWQSATQALLQDGSALPGTSKDSDKIPEKSKDTKGKLFATELEIPATAPEIAMVGTLEVSRVGTDASTRAQAPPIPPPRLA